MRIRSPLSNISDILGQVKESANRYNNTLQANEAATRAVLIDPVLRALGWDTANTCMVEVERTLHRSRVDYALYDNTSKVRIIIEAKALHTNLNRRDFVMNLVDYAFTFGLQDIFLTDGIIWQHFTSFKPGNVEPVKSLNLHQGDPIEIAAYLVQRLDAAKFWPEEQTIDRLAQQVDQLETTVSVLHREFENIKSIVKKQQIIEPILPTQQFIPLIELGDTNNVSPAIFMLPDGTTAPVRRWKDVLVESCKFVLKNNDNIPVPLSDRAGRNTMLFSITKPHNNRSFITEQYNGQMIYIHTNYDRKNCISNSIYILQKTPETMRIKVPAIAVNSI